MTAIPPQPSSAERPRGSSNSLPEGYTEQFEIILQILKDRVSRYDRSRRSPDSMGPNLTPVDEISYGHSHLTKEGLTDNDYTRSMALVEDELDVLKQRNPFAWRVINTYFDVDSGHGDYDFLKAQAERFPSARTNYDNLQMSLYLLVTRLLDTQLYARFPQKIDTRTDRRRSMEERYAEIRRVFADYCRDLAPKNPKKYRVMARDNTALKLNVSKRTIERVLKEDDPTKRGNQS